jgi:inactivated superfamily I helicase
LDRYGAIELEEEQSRLFNSLRMNPKQHRMHNKLKHFRQAKLYNLYSQLSEICMSQLPQSYAELGQETVVFGTRSSR